MKTYYELTKEIHFCHSSGAYLTMFGEYRGGVETEIWIGATVK